MVYEAIAWVKPNLLRLSATRAENNREWSHSPLTKPLLLVTAGALFFSVYPIAVVCPWTAVPQNQGRPINSRLVSGRRLEAGVGQERRR